MKVDFSDPGLIVSGGAHVALLLATLIAFADSRKFEDTQETVPVEMITDQQFNQIMKGDPTLKKQAPQPVKADKLAQIEDRKPTPQVEAKVDVPTPPPPLKRIPDPGDDDTPPMPTPPQRVAALPPPAPTPPPKPDPKPEPPKPQAEAIEPPKPPPRPPEKPRPPKEEVVKPADKPVLDKTALAKLLDTKQPTDTPKPASRPKSGDETTDQKPRLDTNALAKMLSHDTPGQKPSTARALSQTASIGAPNSNAPKMSPSMWGQLDSVMQDQYKQCWSYLGLGSDQRYIPQIKVEFSRDGSLVAQPALLNPPGDPNLRSLSESAMRAVRRCNPLRIPAQFMPFYDQWRNRILRFDPEEMAG